MLKQKILGRRTTVVLLSVTLMAGAALWMNNPGKIAASTNSAPLAPSIIAKSYTNSYSISETSPPITVVKSYSNPSSMDSFFTNIFYIQDKQQLYKGNHAPIPQRRTVAAHQQRRPCQFPTSHQVYALLHEEPYSRKVPLPA